MGFVAMKYQLHDIVLTHARYRGRIYAIVEVVPAHPEEPYLAVSLDRAPFRKRYRLSDEAILAKIGTFDPEALKLDPTQVATPAEGEWEIGQAFAQYMAVRALVEEDRRRWSILARLKPGDPVAIHNRGRTGEHLEVHRFQNVVPQAQKYHFAAVSPRGTIYRWPLEALCLSNEEKK